MNKFTEYKLDISAKDKKIVTEYLETTKEFIAKNSLEEDLYFDIEERVFEKLSSYDSLDQLKVKQSLNEIGQPEDIFEVIEVEEKKKETFFQNLLGKIKKLPENKLLLVAIVIALLTAVFRTPIFLVIALIFGPIIWIGKMFLQYSRNNPGKVSIAGSIKYVFGKIFSAVSSLLGCIKRNMKRIMTLALSVMKFVLIFAKKLFHFAGDFIGYVILFIAIMFLFFVPILYSGFELGNVDYSSFIPAKVIIAYLLALLMMVSLGTFFIFRKRFILHFVTFGASGALLFAFVFLAITELYNSHSYEGKITQTYELTTAETDLRLYMHDINLYGNTYISPVIFDGPMISLMPSESDDVTFKLTTHMFVDNQSAVDTYASIMNPLKVSENNGGIHIEIQGNEIFSEKAHFIPLYRSLEIGLPEGKTFDAHRIYSYSMPYCDNVFEVASGSVVCKPFPVEELVDEVLDEIFSDDILDESIKNAENVAACDDSDGLSQCAQ